MDDVRLAALRQIQTEQNAAREAAQKEKLLREQEIAEIATRERDARVAFEAEQIQARLRAQEAILAAKALAEKEAFDAAVAKKLEELRNRPPIEILRADLEELRLQLTNAKPWLESFQDVRAEVKNEFNSKPWTSDINGTRSNVEELKKHILEVKSSVSSLQKEITELRSEKFLTEVRSVCKKPARPVQVFFFSSMFGPTNAAQQLRLNYSIVPQNEYSHKAIQTTLVAETGAANIQVPDGHKVLLQNAWILQNNAQVRDVSPFYKGILESQ